jgi:AraC-like DNA-binding protein/quercetin dioxygenase-like cupin family protein
MRKYADGYTRIPLRERIRINEVITVHYFKYARDFCVPGETHDFYELVYIDSGSVVIKNGGDEYFLTQGQAFIHRPGVFHNIKAKDTLSNIIIFTYSGKGLSALPLYGRVLTADKRCRAVLEDILSESLRIFEGPPDIVVQYRMPLRADMPEGALQLLKIGIERLLLTLCRLHKAKTPPDTAKEEELSADERICLQIESCLRKNLYNRLTLTDVAKEVGYSVPYIKRIFSRRRNCGILGYCSRLKITAAKELIAEGELSFTQIAERLAFSGIQHFSARFKTVANMTPSAYRKSVQVSKLL